MANAQDIRNAVTRANRIVEEAQFAIKQATEKMGEARLAYAAIQSSKLDGVYSSASNAITTLDQALSITNGIADEANAYAMSV